MIQKRAEKREGVENRRGRIRAKKMKRRIEGDSTGQGRARMCISRCS